MQLTKAGATHALRSSSQIRRQYLVSDTEGNGSVGLWQLRSLLLLTICITLAGCSGSDSPDAATPPSDATDPLITTPVPPVLDQDQSPVSGEVGVVGEPSAPSQQVPDELADINRVALTISTASNCVTVGDNIDLSISRALTDEERAAGTPTEPPDVTPFVTLTQSLGTSLELLSRTDDIARFVLQRQDVVGLTAELDNGSVTAYLSAFAAETPESAVLRKPVVGGCLYAVRVPGFCATGISKSGTLNINRDGLLLSAQGCDIENPTNLPVFELPAVEN